MIKEMVWSRTTKTFMWGAFFGFVAGSFYGVNTQAEKMFKDCRYAGVLRIGEAAFKCDQFSKVVLLTPDEQAKKPEKEEKKK